jgi:hypothetical protein
MSKLVIYRVNGIGSNQQLQQGILEPAEEVDMSQDWGCNWPEFWTQLDPDCDAIIKLSCQGEIQGLVKIGLYPFTGDLSLKPEFVEIANLEAVRGNIRLINPVGLWLIWYAAIIALEYCTGDDESSILKLDAYEWCLEYYRSKVKMDLLGDTTISPNEEGYAFRFTEYGATAFCQRMGEEHGYPQA